MRLNISKNEQELEVGDIVTSNDTGVCMVVYDEDNGDYPYLLVSMETGKVKLSYSVLMGISNSFNLLIKNADLVLSNKL